MTTTTALDTENKIIGIENAISNNSYTCKECKIRLVPVINTKKVKKQQRKFVKPPKSKKQQILMSVVVPVVPVVPSLHTHRKYHPIHSSTFDLSNKKSPTEIANRTREVTLEQPKKKHKKEKNHLSDTACPENHDKVTVIEKLNGKSEKNENPTEEHSMNIPAPKKNSMMDIALGRLSVNRREQLMKNWKENAQRTRHEPPWCAETF